MKGLKQLSFISVATLLTASAYASSYKVGVIDVQKIFNSPDGAQHIQAKLSKKFSGQRDQLQKLLDNLQADQKSYQKNKDTWSKAVLAKKEASFKDEKATFQKQQAEYQQAFSLAQQKEMSNFLWNLKSAAKNVAKKDNLKLVLIKNSVLFADDTKDVTEEVLHNWND